MNRFRFSDALALLGVFGAAVLYLQYLYWAPLPAEDAAMLMRYAEHLAAGHGIVWNVGDAPVDGATDFLFMMMVAGLVRLGVDTLEAVRGLTVGAHLLTVVLVYVANRHLWQAGVAASLFSSVYLAAGTGPAYADAYFGTTVFALAATVTWVLALRILVDPAGARPASAVAFALSALVTGLIRPEGVILSGLMLAAIVAGHGWSRARSVVIGFAGIFATLGGAYFLWRWQYFGHPLPNPFYKKGGGQLYWDSLDFSLVSVSRFARPFLPVFVLGLWSASATRWVIVALIPIIGFASAFVLLSNEMNYAARFQYVLLPLILVTWVPIVQAAHVLPRPETIRQRLAWGLTLGILAFGCVRYATSQHCVFNTRSSVCGPEASENGLATAGKLLSEYRDRGYVVAVTEAGLVPYYSGWRAIDTWGLNDAWIAHNGGVTDAYLDQWKPHVIVMHAYFSPSSPPQLTAANLADDWFAMTIRLKQYAESRGYVLAAVFGRSPQNTHYYYVRPDFSDSTRLVEQLSSLDYETGMTNYAPSPVPAR